MAPIVVALCADEAQDITGQCFFVWGGAVNVLRPWEAGELFAADERWDADDFLAELRARFPEGAAPPGMVEMMARAGGRSRALAESEPRSGGARTLRAPRGLRLALFRRRWHRSGELFERARRLARRPQRTRGRAGRPGRRVRGELPRGADRLQRDLARRRGRHACDLPAAAAPSSGTSSTAPERALVVATPRVRGHGARGGRTADGRLDRRASPTSSRPTRPDRAARRRRPRGAACTRAARPAAPRA